MWSFRALDRNISTQYYERRLAAQREKSALPVDMENSTDPLEYIKNPMMAEFMGFHRDADYNESDFEKALIDNLEKFIMELGRGFAFVERQQHIVTDTDDFYIDLVFYNYRMKRFVIFELKTHKLTHQDIGQLDMYVRMYDDLIKGADDAPTIGVLLCTDTDNTIARYSVLHDNNQLFAAKYMTYMPTEEELRNEIEQQKRFFMEQHGSRNLLELKLCKFSPTRPVRGVLLLGAFGPSGRVGQNLRNLNNSILFVFNATPQLSFPFLYRRHSSF